VSGNRSDGASAADGLDAAEVKRARAKLETNGFRYTRRRQRPLALHRADYQLIPAPVAPIWLVLLTAVLPAQFSAGPAGAADLAAVVLLDRVQTERPDAGSRLTTQSGGPRPGAPAEHAPQRTSDSAYALRYIMHPY
jgi:hypothetical protein